MKNLILTTFLSVLCLHLSAQSWLSVQQKSSSFNKEVKPALSVSVEGTISEVKDAVSTFFSSKHQLALGKLKVGKEKKLLGIKDASSELFSEGSFHLYHRFTQQEKTILVETFMVEKNDQFVDHSTNSNSSLVLKKVMQSFAKEYYIVHYTGMLNSERKLFSKIEKKTVKYEKSYSKTAKKIAVKQESIDKNQLLIDEKREKIRATQLEIDGISNKIATIKKEQVQIKKETAKEKELLDGQQKMKAEKEKSIEKIKARLAEIQ